MSNPDAASPFATIFARVGIPHADKIVLVIIVIAIFSAVNSAIYATSRSLYSRIQGSSTYVGKKLGKLSKNQVPTNAILVSSFVLFIGVLLSAVLGDGFWQFVAGSISFTISIVWILLLVAALVLYFKHKEVTNWFVKLATLVVLIALSLVFIMQIITNPWTLSVFALVICLLSYFSYRKKKA